MLTSRAKGARAGTTKANVESHETKCTAVTSLIYTYLGVAHECAYQHKGLASILSTVKETIF